MNVIPNQGNGMVHVKSAATLIDATPIVFDFEPCPIQPNRDRLFGNYLLDGLFVPLAHIHKPIDGDTTILKLRALLFGPIVGVLVCSCYP